MDNRVNDITEAFLQSYHDLGGINHIHGPNLPSKSGIEKIISDLESLVFPGFKTEEALDGSNLRFTISETVSRLIRNLSTEITRAVCFKNRVTNKAQCIHNESTGVGQMCRIESEELTQEIVALIPQLRQCFKNDVAAAFAGDPASRSTEEVILSYPGVEAIIIHRIANLLWVRDIPLLPRMMSEAIHSRTGIDIHPGATIGDSFYIDHGTGVVIGETSVIGDRVKLYQGVTLGALSVSKNKQDTKRHPTIEDDVTIYSGATILGGRTVIGKGSTIGGNVWLTSSVPAGSVVIHKPSDYSIKTDDSYTIEFQI